MGRRHSNARRNGGGWATGSEGGAPRNEHPRGRREHLSAESLRGTATVERVRLERRSADEGSGLRGGRHDPAVEVVKTALAIKRRTSSGQLPIGRCEQWPHSPLPVSLLQVAWSRLGVSGGSGGVQRSSTATAPVDRLSKGQAPGAHATERPGSHRASSVAAVPRPRASAANRHAQCYRARGERASPLPRVLALDSGLTLAGTLSALGPGTVSQRGRSPLGHSTSTRPIGQA